MSTAVLAPAGAVSEADDATVWLEEAAAAAGIENFDVDEIVARETVYEDGVATVTEITGEAALAHLATDLERLPEFEGVTPGAQDGVVGHLLLHVLLSIGYCSGYDVEPIAESVARVRADGYSLGLHAAISPAAAAATGSPQLLLATGVDLGDPTALAAVHLDSSLWAVGDVAVSQTDYSFLGFCFATIGDMSGTGAFLFDGAAADVPI